jgi:MYXO-CTERM domain-containing protein
VAKDPATSGTANDGDGTVTALDSGGTSLLVGAAPAEDGRPAAATTSERLEAEGESITQARPMLPRTGPLTKDSVTTTIAGLLALLGLAAGALRRRVGAE